MNYEITVTRENIRRFPSHTHHGVWELMCYIRGEGVLATEDGDFPFHENTVFAVPPEFVHGSRGDTDFVNICLHAPLPIPEKRLYIIPDGEVLRGLFDAARRIDTETPENREALSHLILAIGDLVVSSDPSEKTPERMLYERICDDFTDPDFSIAEALLHVRGSADHIRHRFRARYGITPAQLCEQRRIEYAKTLMRIYGERLKFYELSAACGYRDPLYFSRRFKKETGVSPAAYRKEILHEEEEENQ